MNLVDRAIEILRRYEPTDGYYLAFSGGKDSVTIKKLAQMAGVKFDAHYNNVTIDPPELVRFIKNEHRDVGWNAPKYGNLFHRIATRPSLPPTRFMRWCCDEYKEGGGKGRIKILGVRSDESPARAERWKEVSIDSNGDTCICPIFIWTDSQVWNFIHNNCVPYCELYDEGWTRLGCVGCPLQCVDSQSREFRRYPLYERNWHNAIVANWNRYHNRTKRDGMPYTHAKFPTAEDLWIWWRTSRKFDGKRCGR